MVRVGNKPNWRRILLEHVDSIPKKDLEEYIGTSDNFKGYNNLDKLYNITSEMCLNLERIRIIQKYGVEDE